MITFTLKIEERISIDTLDELKQAFESADVDGYGRLNFEQFKEILKAELHLPSSKVCLFCQLVFSCVIMTMSVLTSHVSLIGAKLLNVSEELKIETV